MYFRLFLCLFLYFYEVLQFISVVFGTSLKFPQQKNVGRVLNRADFTLPKSIGCDDLVSPLIIMNIAEAVKG